MKNTSARAVSLVLMLLLLLTAIGCSSEGTITLGSKSPAASGVLPPATAYDLFKSFGFTEEEFVAELYAQSGYLSSVYDLDVQMKDGQVYLNGRPYDQITYSQNPELDYQSMMTFQEDADLQNTLQKIEEQVGCWILENEGTAQKMAVYYVDGAHYFASMTEDGTVSRIFKIIQDAQEKVQP